MIPLCEKNKFKREILLLHKQGPKPNVLIKHQNRKQEDALLQMNIYVLDFQLLLLYSFKDVPGQLGS